MAKFAPAIAGVSAFKKLKTSLEDVEPALLEAAEAALRRLSDEAVERLFEEARRAVAQSSKTWREFRKTVEKVERRGRAVKPTHAAVAWALLEAGLKELGGVAERAAHTLREATERLARGEEAVVRVGDIAELGRRAGDAAHRLRLLFSRVVENAEMLAKNEQEAEAIKKDFTVSEIAEKLAAADTRGFHRLGKATLADKAVAFFESLAEGTAWSRVVLNAVGKRETYGALVKAPKSARNSYSAGAEGGDAWVKLLHRLADWLAGRGVEEFAARLEGGVVKVLVGGEEVAEVKRRAAGSGTIFKVRGRWAEEEGQRALEVVKKVEAGKAEPYQVRALLATDGKYHAGGEVVYAGTTSVLQAALFRRLGIKKVSYAGHANLTEDGLKPALVAWLPKEKGGAEWVGLVKRDLEHGVKTLLGDKALREGLLHKALDLLGRVEFASGKEAKDKVRDRVEKFLGELRLGEGGAVCLQGAGGCEYVLTYKHESYPRVIAPLIHYIAENAPREEVTKFLTYSILYDGSVSPDTVYLAVGQYGARKKKLPLDIYDKIALYIIFAAKYGVDVQRVYVREGVAKIIFSRGYAAEAFATTWAELSWLWRFGREQELYADHLFKKLQHVREYVEERAKNIKIEHVLRGDKATVYFRDETGREIVHINVGWDGESLQAYFGGARERAERLASILNALGADAEARERGGFWHVVLTTSAITAIRHPDWLNAVKSLVEELYKNGKITERQRDRLLREIEAGPNVVEVADVEMSMWLGEIKTKTGKTRLLVIVHQPTSPEAFKAAVKALREAGFVEGVHYTAKAPEGGKQGFIRLRLPAGLWKLVELERNGVGWAKRALDKLEEIAKARGFYDLLEEYLRPAKEAETANPRDVVAEDKERGIKAVIIDVRMVWIKDKNGNTRPRIVVEYEAGGRKKSFYFTWKVVKEGRVHADVGLNYEKAAVLAALTGDESLKEKEKVTLTTRHLFALAKYKGIGWDLLWWYAGR